LKRTFVRNIIIQYVLLFAFWLLLSGHYDFIHIFYGVISVSAVVWLNYRLKKYAFFEEEMSRADANLKGNKPVTIRFFRLFFYIPWLIWQIVIASLQVAVVVLNPKMPIEPAIIKFKSRLPSLSARVILANSITLTPGTITLQLLDDEFIVHALMDMSATGITEDSLPAQVAKLYEKKPSQVAYKFEIIKSQGDM